VWESIEGTDWLGIHNSCIVGSRTYAIMNKLNEMGHADGEKHILKVLGVRGIRLKGLMPRFLVEPEVTSISQA
jgi:hypothetical protein